VPHDVTSWSFHCDIAVWTGGIDYTFL